MEKQAVHIWAWKHLMTSYDPEQKLVCSVMAVAAAD